MYKTRKLNDKSHFKVSCKVNLIQGNEKEDKNKICKKLV